MVITIIYCKYCNKEIDPVDNPDKKNHVCILCCIDRSDFNDPMPWIKSDNDKKKNDKNLVNLKFNRGI